MIFDDDDDLEMLGFGSQWADYAVSATIRHERAKQYDRDRRGHGERASLTTEVRVARDRMRARKRRAALGVEASRAETRRYCVEYRKRKAAERGATTYVCQQCGCSWERGPSMGGRKPKFCTRRCADRALWQKKKAGAQ